LNAGRKLPDRTFEVSSHGTKNRIRIEPPKKMTPSSLLSMMKLKSMARRIA